jgi:hypothetical protein
MEHAEFGLTTEQETQIEQHITDDELLVQPLLKYSLLVSCLHCLSSGFKAWSI